MARKQWVVAEVSLKEAFTSLGRDLPDHIDDALYRIGDDIRKSAKRRAPVDTSALRESICVTTRKKSDYSGRVGTAKGLRPEASFGPKTRPPKKAVDIHVPIHYATYQELGTIKNRAQPFLIPAVFMVVKNIDRYFKDAIKTSIKYTTWNRLAKIRKTFKV